MTRGNDYDGLLVAVEGIDGSGKSTLVEQLQSRIESLEEECVTTAEPTDAASIDVTNTESSAVRDVALFVADRVTHIEQTIQPALERGAVVITDRYEDSTRAYQTHRVAAETEVSYAEARNWIDDMFKIWNVQPDLVLYLDVPVDIALDRCDTEDKFETQENLRQVKEAYDQLYSHCDGDVRIYDGTMAPMAIAQRAENAIKARLHDPEPLDGQTYAEALREELE